MSTLPYTSRMVVSSISLILCGLFNFVLTLLRKALGIIDTVTDIALSNLDYTQIETWTDILTAVANIRAVYTLSVNTLTVLQIISGIVGIIFAITVNSKKTAEKAQRFKIIPFICGIITCVFGAISYLSLLLSKNSSVFSCIIMFITVITVSIIFTVSSKYFWKGDKS